MIIMKEQTYEIEKTESFHLPHIFECGQCFRWNQQEDGSYTGVIKEGVLNVKETSTKIIFSGMLEGQIQSICTDYFDLETDYDKIKKQLSVIDEHMRNSIEYGKGIRILHQDLWECIVSFIISANNNIPRIKSIIEKLATKYGSKVDYQQKTYYLFPTPEQLKDVTVEEFRQLGLGFRDKRVFHTTQAILNQNLNLEELQWNQDTQSVKEQLLSLDGVGEKVADCILLFALKRYDVIPIDVWVRRVINELYIHSSEEAKLKPSQMKEIVSDKFSPFSGIAQQYLFYARRSRLKAQ